jgi:hypothetical protein
MNNPLDGSILGESIKSLPPTNHSPLVAESLGKPEALPLNEFIEKHVH